MTYQAKIRIVNYTIAIILICLGMFFTCRAHAATFPFNMEYLINPGDEDYIDPKHDFSQKCIRHAYWSRKYFQKAQDITWYMPNYDDRELAKTCFSTAFATAMPPHNLSKVIIVAIGLFTKYGLDCMDSFHEVNHYLHRAAYHSEMYDFYLELVPEDNDEEPEEEW